MVLVAIVALGLASCAPLYEQTGAITLRFTVGAEELSPHERGRLAEALAPLARNPLAEVEFTTFPYRDSEISPAVILAKSRFDHLRSRAAEVGVSPGLVGGSISAAGWTYEGAEVRAIPHPAEQLEAVDVRFRVKAKCHPLAELARESDPYRTQ